MDSMTADRIRAWEAEHARPLALWSLIGIGALAIGLGLISVVAANWDAIPGTTRLAIHFALLVVGAGGFWWSGNRPQNWFGDAALFVLAALGLTFFGHIGQVYQTSSPLWQPLAIWLLLFTPLLLGYGRTWLVAGLWFAGLAMTCWQYAEWFGGLLDARTSATRDVMVAGLVLSIPVLAAGLAAAMRGQSARPDFWRRLEQAALIYGVGAASLLLIAAGYNEPSVKSEWQFAIPVVAIALVTAALIAFCRRTASGKATAVILVTGAALVLLAIPLAGSEIAGGVLFMLFWGVIAAAALHAGWRAVFQGAVAVLALRLIILSFELASDLLGSGVGLILAGVATLGVAWAAIRISRRYAPPKEAEQ